MNYFIFRKALWQINKLDGRGGEGGDSLAADAGQTKLLGGSKHNSETNIGGKQAISNVTMYERHHEYSCGEIYYT